MPSDIFRLNGPKLAELRYRAGFTQSGLAAQLGVHRNYIGRIESGKFEPAPARLVAIAAVLGVEIDAITVRAA
jgi:transcriptional regulator with XRE-family HTH domain